MQLDINLRAIVIFYRGVPGDAAGGGGRAHRNALVVNTASIAGKHGASVTVGVLGHQARGGRTGHARCTSSLGQQGIKSTALCPAFVDTPMTDYVKGCRSRREEMIRPEDIAEAVSLPAAGLSRVHCPGDVMFIRPAGQRRCSYAPATCRAKPSGQRLSTALIDDLAPADRTRICLYAETRSRRRPNQRGAREARRAMISLPWGPPLGSARAGTPVARERPGVAPSIPPGEVARLPVLLRQARTQEANEDRELVLGGPAPPAGVREAIPGASEGEEVGAPAAAVRGEHRTHAALAVGGRRRRSRGGSRAPLRASPRGSEGAGTRPRGAAPRSAGRCESGRLAARLA